MLPKTLVTSLKLLFVARQSTTCKKMSGVHSVACCGGVPGGDDEHVQFLKANKILARLFLAHVFLSSHPPVAKLYWVCVL